MGKKKKIGKVRIIRIVKASPRIIKIVRAKKPKTREKIKKTIFSIKVRWAPAPLSILQGKKRVFKNNGIEKALKA